MRDLKVLIAEKELFHYRVPFFNKLASQVKHLTVCHCGIKKTGADIRFKEVLLKKSNISRFVFEYGLISLAKDHDVVITKFSLDWVSMISLSLIPGRKFKVIHWGIGVTSDNGFDRNHSKDFLRYFFAKRCDALIFYSDYPVLKYKKHLIPEQKMFVAHNTVEVENDYYTKKEGEYFLFVGSIHKRKKLEELLKAQYILQKRGYVSRLKIIGKGMHRPEVEKFASELGIDSSVSFLGEIKGQELGEHFSRAIATISPGQAGLSVLESMAYGTPFITNVDAITGGERLNIINGVNGFLYEGDAVNLADIMQELLTNKPKQRQMSIEAFAQYNRRRIGTMVEGFLEALKHVTEKD